MSQKSPYYHNEDERKQLMDKMKSFEFADIDSIPDTMFVVIQGEAGAGKTHLAVTMSELMPIYVLDSEKRGLIVVKKFAGKTKFPIKYTQIDNYADMIAAIKAILIKYKNERGMIIIDSGSDVQQFAEAEYLRRAKKDKVYPITLWAEIYDMLDTPVEDIRKAGFLVCMTARMKDEYIADRKTGSQIPRIYNRAPYWADLIVEVSKDPKKPQTVVKNGFAETQTIEFDTKLTLPSIIKKAQLADSTPSVTDTKKTKSTTTKAA